MFMEKSEDDMGLEILTENVFSISVKHLSCMFK